MSAAETNSMHDNEILTLQQAADELHVSSAHLSKIVRGCVRGVPRIPHVRAGRRLLIRRGSINLWIAECEGQTAT